MEGLVNLSETFRGKSVLVTGHTGFKGSWLVEWLVLLGAKVTGFALRPDTQPALFDQLQLENRIDHVLGDVRDADAVSLAVRSVQPDFVFHLAAQPLVRRSYREPVMTWETNVTGTLHVLEALRRLEKPCAAVFITTDKVYENREWAFAYREDEPLGGHDPYSSSKAAAEIGIAAWRRSFFTRPHPVKIASARAGNVIGGGDWAQDRIVPDAMRALAAGEKVAVRNPHATRPWQHVLEPLSGYLRLAARLADGDELPGHAFNFGPSLASNRSVARLVDEMLRHWPGTWIDASDPTAVHEAGKLNLAADRAYHHLGWQPRWDFETTVEKTVDWYRNALEHSADISQLVRAQIQDYVAELDCPPTSCP